MNDWTRFKAKGKRLDWSTRFGGRYVEGPFKHALGGGLQEGRRGWFRGQPVFVPAGNAQRPGARSRRRERGRP